MSWEQRWKILVNWKSLLIAALAGASMAVQGALNAVLGKKAGSFEASFVVHVAGSVILGLILLTGLSGGDLRKVGTAPWWAFLGAPLSVVIIWGVLKSIGDIGVGVATTAIVAAQISMALVLDHLGITDVKAQMTPGKIVGALIFMIGAYLLLRDSG
jgi:transporter family-2 protein